MDLLDHFRRMARNNLWSNDRLYRAVLVLKPGEFEAERTSFFPSIKETLNHILAVDHLYLDFLEEGGVGAAAHDDFVPFGDPMELAAAQAIFDRRLIAFCDRLSDADLDRRVITDRREDGMIPEKIGDILAHLFIHDIHHRGQVHAMLSGTSVKPPQLDEFFLDYDLKLRKAEVERLELGSQAKATS
ncbi:MAG: damage-inducible protein DinB [Mesorhizobium sp.]|uniref:DinB family protein n=1 Tax=unclassified Mesorhizobium TaxID=325217 RepID=UPI000FCB09D5|nr:MULTISPECIES: DinB family protein [unclassified Mesorhizobium]RUV75316.1 damage-inducible protein DinB [Mesorhizobium sp. M5C.F.Cr.IN.023.01.1.1]RWF88996.1 MAG: damage-inducible protein DinB [Mesorhizobium sp.]RWF95577.1 MAG: damage-inducible protein DinB [Mesorhizobium sp.]RWI40175.1 MAG: damage-inducible protein DinB [Mesorhizobium sp.]RWI45859.1 MAG: damage-inducible protein DinB [Mesorhizobium sp.]